MPTRRCIVESDSGPATIRLLANNLLRAGADFVVEEESGEERESWKQIAGVDGSTDHQLKLEVATLGRNVMLWEVLVCSPDGKIDRGDVEIQVLQRGVPCAMTKPAHWTLTKVPPCEGNKAVSIKASLRFLLD